MTNFLTDDYHTLAMRTAAGPEVFHLPKDREAPFFGQTAQEFEFEMVSALLEYFEAAMKLDRIKSMLFYGKDKPAMVAMDLLNVIKDVTGTDDPEIAIRDVSPQLIHAILGIASEGGELVENLLQLFVFRGSDRREVFNNIARETGDIDWFQELLAHAIDIPVDQSRSENIARLRARFPDKFSEEDAIARADETPRPPEDIDVSDFDNPANKTGLGSFDDTMS